MTRGQRRSRCPQRATQPSNQMKSAVPEWLGQIWNQSIGGVGPQPLRWPSCIVVPVKSSVPSYLLSTVQERLSCPFSHGSIIRDKLPSREMRSHDRAEVAR
jgi:hypothetical protein